MAGLENYDCEGVLTIGGQSFNNPAWAVLGDEEGEGGLLQLIGLGAELRGENRIVPYAFGGVIPYVKRRTETRYDLRILVCGDVDETGTPYPNKWDGLVDNLDTLRTILDDIETPPSGLLAATVDFGSATYTANIQMLSIKPLRYHKSDDQVIFEGTLQINVPAGRFE